VHARSIVLFLTAIVLATGCETSTDPFIGFGGDGETLTQAQADGTWSFTVQRSATFACPTTALTNGSVIVANLDVLSNGLLTTASTWQNPISGAVQPLSGSVNLSNGATDLTFAAPSVRSDAAMELIPGTMTSGGSLTGTLIDPAAGFSQVFGTGACAYTVTGSKTS